MRPRLIVLNGPPAVGKSTLARRYADDHPLTLALDVDRIRDLVGGWRDDPGAAGLLARRVTVAAARAHLLGGPDSAAPGPAAPDVGGPGRAGFRPEADPARPGGPAPPAGTDSHRRAGGSAQNTRPGHDVVVPQLVARPGFLEQLEAVAEETGATFHELVLMDEKAAVLRRFAERARTVAGALQVEQDEVAALYDRLTAYLARRPRAVVVPAIEGRADETYRAMLAHV